MPESPMKATNYKRLKCIVTAIKQDVHKKNRLTL